MKRSSLWKLVGLAGLAGVAATGVAVARSERERRAYTPEEVRARLQDRMATLDVGQGVAGVESLGGRPWPPMEKAPVEACLTRSPSTKHPS